MKLTVLKSIEQTLSCMLSVCC